MSARRSGQLALLLANAGVALALQLAAAPGLVRTVAPGAPTGRDLLAWLAWCALVDVGLALALFVPMALLAERVRPALSWSLVALAGATFLLVVVVDDLLFAAQGVHLYSPVALRALTNADADRELHLGWAGVGIVTGGLLFALALEAVAIWALCRRARPLRLRPLLTFGALTLFAAAVGVWSCRARLFDLSSPLAPALPFAELLARSRPPARAFTVRYPGPLPPHAMTKRPDILLIAVESLRASAFGPELMPRLSQFAKEHTCVRSEHHFSSSHATELGVFSLLYGLDASRYQPFQAARTPSALLTILRDNGYVVRGGSSSALRRWNGAGFLVAQLDGYREPDDPESWRRDVALTDWARSLPRQSPSFTFLFLDATHLDYSYPPELELDRPVLRGDFTRYLARGSLRAHEREVVNRYRNAVRFIDRQLGELLAGVGDDTVVIVTGDHGEELWEAGLLGHSSPSFIDPRIQVPLVFCLPDGAAPTVGASAHADLLPTVLAWAGVPAPADGVSLLGPRRQDLVVSAAGFPVDSGELCLIDDQRKRWLRADPSWRDHFRLVRQTDLDDHPIGDGGVGGGVGGGVSKGAPDDGLDAHLRAYLQRFHRFLSEQP